MGEKLQFESKLGDLTEEQIVDLAKEGRSIFDDTGMVPRNTLESFALAAEIRLGKAERAARYGRSGHRPEKDDDEEQVA